VFTFCIDWPRKPITAAALDTVEMSMVAVSIMITLLPARVMFWLERVMLPVASASVRNSMLGVIVPFSRLAPSKAAFSTTWEIWRRRARKLEFTASREMVSSELSWADRTFSFISLRRSEIDSPAG
jgi:hypothetical protein